MPHAKSLRAIGQSLELLGLTSFVLEKRGQDFILHSDELPDLIELGQRESLAEKVWDSSGSSRRIAKLLRADGTLGFDNSYIAWIDAQGRRKRRKRFSAQATGTKRLSQLLRTLGRHLERVEAYEFKISWHPAGAELEHRSAHGKLEQETFTADKLRDLTLRLRFRRAPRR
ncbi:MAG TPA: hypothetical protein VK632_10785 [Verrucomicrobiae bacterium]|nr:hypothetical protein [Verrucomicrobiae bacterium]